MESQPLRVIFADDNYLVREGVSRLLAEAESIDVVESVADAQALSRVVDELEPNAVLTDIRMPPTFTNEGIVVAKSIRARHPDTGVVVLSQYAEPDDVFELLADGVSGLGYLLKERVSDLDELVRALHEVVRGGSVLDPKVVESLLSRDARDSQSPLRDLTERERAVLAEMAAGRSNAMIAKTLYLSSRAVEKHISSIFQKLGLADERDVNRRVLAVLAYLEAGGRDR